MNNRPAPVDDVLSRLQAISAAIARAGGQAQAIDEALRLIVQCAADSTHSLSALYRFDAVLGVLSAAPLVAAGDHAPPVLSETGALAALGLRAIARVAPALSYTEAGYVADDVAQGAVACFPVHESGQALGVMYLYLPAAERLSDDMLLLVRCLADLAALTLRSVRLTDVQRDLARKDEEFNRLSRAGRLISSRTRLQDTLQAILHMAFEVTGAEYGILRLVDKSGHDLVTHAVAGKQLGRPLTEALPINATSISGLVAKLRQPLCIADVRAEPWSRIYYPLDHVVEMRSELTAPLIGSGGRLEGIIDLESPLVGAFSEQDSLLLQALAAQAVIAIQEVRLLDALRDVAERLLTQPCQQMLDHLAELARDVLYVEAGVVWLLDGDSLNVAAATLPGMQGRSLPLAGTLIGQAVTTRSVVAWDDVRAAGHFPWRDLAQSQGWSWALIVPLLASDSAALGAFSVFGKAADAARQAASDWDEKVLATLAHYAVLAVRNAENQAALRAAQEQRAAAETFAAVGDVAANLLHNLNNKIGTIPVRVEGIEDKSAAAIESDPYLANHLREIGRSAREAMEVVRTTLAHLQSSPLGPVSLAECVSDALHALRPPAGVHVQVSGLESLPPVTAGRHGLALVFSNLLENAIDAMNGAGAVSIEGMDQAGTVRVAVRDSGPGIAPDLHERIFDLHYSGRRATRANRLGFGLWWVRTFMTRLGGSIAVESDGHAGATFVLRLPCAREKT